MKLVKSTDADIISAFDPNRHKSRSGDDKLLEARDRLLNLEEHSAAIPIVKHWRNKNETDTRSRKNLEITMGRTQEAWAWLQTKTRCAKRNKGQVQ